MQSTFIKIYLLKIIRFSITSAIIIVILIIYYVLKNQYSKIYYVDEYRQLLHEALIKTNRAKPSEIMVTENTIVISPSIKNISLKAVPRILHRNFTNINFYSPSFNLRDLSGLKVMLLGLHNTGTRKFDYTPLADFKSIRQLTLSGFNIEDLNSFPNMPELKILILIASKVCSINIDFFSHFPNLSTLVLDNIRIEYTSDSLTSHLNLIDLRLSGEWTLASLLAINNKSLRILSVKNVLWPPSFHIFLPALQQISLDNSTLILNKKMQYNTISYFYITNTQIIKNNEKKILIRDFYGSLDYLEERIKSEVN